MTVAIEVDEHCTGRTKIGARNAGALGNIFKTEIPQVAIKAIAAVDATEIKVAKAVAVDIARRHTGTVEKDVVGEVDRFRDGVGEIDPGISGAEGCEAGFARFWNRQINTAIAGPLLP